MQVRKPVDGVDVRRRSGCVFELVSGKQLKVNFWDRACMELGNVIRVSEINGRVLKRSLLLELAVALAFCECDVRKMMVTGEKAQLQQGTSPSCIFLSDSVSVKVKGKRSCTTKPLSPPSQHRRTRWAACNLRSAKDDGARLSRRPCIHMALGPASPPPLQTVNSASRNTNPPLRVFQL